MASGGKSKASSGGGAEAAKRRRVGFAGVLPGQELQDEGDEEYTFDPEFAERVSGDDGKIYGYKGLKSAGGKKTPCTDVLAKLKEVFGDGLTEDRDSFQQNLLAYSQDFQQMLERHGEVVSSWRSEASSAPLVKEANADPEKDSESLPLVKEANADAEKESESPEKLKQIVRVELVDPALRDWHARLTPLSLLFIEGAQGIESDDPLWEVYLALEGEGPEMKVAGFCNVYRFYHYPDSTRLRISQILVLPPYQGDGFGLHLLQAVNTAATARGCYDVTMEEPSVTLQKLRDTMDVLRLLPLPSLDEAIKDALSKLQAKKELELPKNGSEVVGDQCGALVNFNGSDVDPPSRKSRPGSKEKSVLAPPAHFVEEIRKKFKISKMQCKRCWEQLLFMYLDPKDRDLQDVFQEALVERLNLEIFEKENGNKTAGKKHVPDTDNEYDNSKTFVMMRGSKIIDVVDGNGCTVPNEESDVPGDEGQALTPGPEEKAKVLPEGDSVVL